MPLSAKSPDGPVSLVGMDITTLENLKARNRKEKIFTAKCCGAPVQIRTPAGKIPHFYHLSTTPGCLGSKGETQQHLGLKARIAAAALLAGWDVEVEAEERRPDGTLVWKADVLAQRGKAKVAFEVQVSSPDWNDMMERQERYKQSGVRGLWFVTTKKPFPAIHGLPLFNLQTDTEGWLVNLKHHNDWVDEWSETWGKVNLDGFIRSALGGGLKWSRMNELRSAPCEVEVRILGWGRCGSCAQFIGHVYALTMSVSEHPELPSFAWHQGMTNRRTFWVDQILRLLQPRLAPTQAGFVDRLTHSCMSCGVRVNVLAREEGSALTKLSLSLSEIAKPRFGTIEWDWVNRWTLSESAGTRRR